MSPYSDSLGKNEECSSEEEGIDARPAQTADPPLESHGIQCPHPPRATFSLPVLRWIGVFPLQMISSPNDLFSSKRLALSLGLGAY